MRWLSVYLSALLVALVSGVPLLTLGLVLHESISRSLWLVVSALLAAIAASGPRNFSSELRTLSRSPDRRPSHLVFDAMPDPIREARRLENSTTTQVRDELVDFISGRATRGLQERQ